MTMNYDEIFINELFQNDGYIVLNNKCISQQVLLLLKQMDFNPSIEVTNEGYKIYKNKIVDYELRKKRFSMIRMFMIYQQLMVYSKQELEMLL